MTKNLLLSCLSTSTLLLFALRGQNPNEKEIQSVPENDFINFSGRHRQVDSRKAIYDIGRYLANNIKEGKSSYYGKYTLIRSLTPGNEGMFDADIIQLEPRAAVDHVRNLRLIIAGYLSTLYDISEERALTLATFITYYNLHYRGQKDYFEGKYKPEVLPLLSAAKIGLAKDYRQWAGQSQIVVPISRDTMLNVPPQPDLAEAGQPVVVEKVMESEDEETALELRRDLIGQRKDKLEQQQDTLDQIAGQQQQQKKELTVDRNALNRTIQQSDSSKEREDAEQQLAENADAVQKNRQQQERINRKQQQLSQQKDAITKEENQLEQDRQTTALDNPALYFPLLSTNPEGEHRLVRLSLAAARITGQSEVKALRSASLLVRDNALYLISGKPDARLTQVDPGSLKVVGQSKEAVFPVAAIWQFNDLDGLFTVIADGEQWLLGHFDDALNLLGKSTEAILPYTSLRYLKGKLLLQDAAGRLIVLDGLTLAKEAEIKP